MSFVLISCSDHSGTSERSGSVKVGIYYGQGASETCSWEAETACRMDPTMDVFRVTTSDIASGLLDRLDVLVMPGGGGSTEYLNMGGQNAERVKDFIRRGGGYVGICAGAYVATNTPDYACLRISGSKAIDIEHDNRGRGVAKVTLNEEGKLLFPELASEDTLYLMYYEGPVLVPAEGDSVSYRSLATMESDVHVEGNAPENMTNDKPFFTISNYGKGKVFCSIGHPEATPGMQWMIARAVRYVSDGVQQTFDADAIDPHIFGTEILMDADRREKESSSYKVLLYGTAEEKISTIDWFEAHLSWSAKRWMQGMIFDPSPAVRARTAEFFMNTRYTHYVKELDVARSHETDPTAKEVMDRAYVFLRKLRTE